MVERQGYRGYVTSRGFGGYNIPVPVQSLVLRDYCARKSLLYVLPVNENLFPHSYMVLEGMIRDLSAYQGVVMCSMHMLPQRVERRRQIYDSILGHGAELRLILEEQIIRKDADVDKLEDLLALCQLAQQATPIVSLGARGFSDESD